MNQGCSSTLGVIARILAVVCAVMMVIAADISLVAVNVERRFFNPDVYKRALDSQGVYDRLPALLAEQVAESAADAGGESGSLQLLDRQDWEAIMTDIFPPAWFEAQTESVIDQLFAWIESDETEGVISFSMVEVKERLAGEEGAQMVRRIFDSMPACTDAETASWAAAQLAGGGDLPECRPPDELLDAVMPQIETALDEAAAGIPDQQEIPLTADPQNDFRPALRAIRAVSLLSPLIPIGLLFAIAILAVRSLRGLLMWWGFPILIAGLFGLLLALAVLPVESYLLDTIRSSASGEISAAFVEMIVGVVEQIISGLALWIGAIALMLTIGGGGMAGIGVYLNAIRRTETPATTVG